MVVELHLLVDLLPREAFSVAVVNECACGGGAGLIAKGNTGKDRRVEEGSDSFVLTADFNPKIERETYTGGSPFQFLFLVPFLGEPQRVDGICSGKHQSACLLSSIEIVLAPASSSTDVSVTLNSFDTIATEDNSLGLVLFLVYKFAQKEAKTDAHDSPRAHWRVQNSSGKAIKYTRRRMTLHTLKKQHQIQVREEDKANFYL
ncbi:hypothetical protein DM860_002983 [Cuscuta australis]|uniref:Uncharacterized protein n=1 Tax=Cuscuta australis TaxID=267555 RepID=A0A328D2Z0_9ASTE|nr:hypothetical protein DM860_002983 [Cuscuta australis]